MAEVVGAGGPTVLDAFDAAAQNPFGKGIAVVNAVDAVADRLVTAIALGVYVPGQRLPVERELAAMLEVSRMTVREGIRRLVDGGYLQVRRGPHGGSFVLSGWGPTTAEMVRRQIIPNWAEWEALFDARRLLEGLIAATAAERRGGRDIEVLLQASADYRAASDREASRSADARLHRAVAEATRNPVLVRLSLQMRARVSLGLGAEPYTAQVREAAVHQHDDLARAIVEKDGVAAAAIAREHFGLTEQLIRELVDRVRTQQAEPTEQAGEGS